MRSTAAWWLVFRPFMLSAWLSLDDACDALSASRSFCSRSRVPRLVSCALLSRSDCSCPRREATVSLWFAPLVSATSSLSLRDSCSSLYLAARRCSDDRSCSSLSARQRSFSSLALAPAAASSAASSWPLAPVSLPLSLADSALSALRWLSASSWPLTAAAALSASSAHLRSSDLTRVRRSSSCSLPTWPLEICVCRVATMSHESASLRPENSSSAAGRSVTTSGRSCRTTAPMAALWPPMAEAAAPGDPNTSCRRESTLALSPPLTSSQRSSSRSLILVTASRREIASRIPSASS
ncbi:hypothetical protein F5883DRAFT_553874 [Diaporthe sp. PMI_573]|nr:hypothetical protein F5883DRAFT_553874 [Diaporthaceae sp. PMI_573]